jgi:hypothetical protein
MLTPFELTIPFFLTCLLVNCYGPRRFFTFRIKIRYSILHTILWCPEFYCQQEHLWTTVIGPVTCNQKGVTHPPLLILSCFCVEFLKNHQQRQQPKTPVTIASALVQLQDSFFAMTELGNTIWHYFILQSGESRSQDSSVSIASGYGLDGPGSIPSSTRFFSSPQLPGRLSGPPSHLSNGYQGLFPQG